MQGSSRALGSPVAIHFNGRDYRIHGLGAEDWGTVEAHLLSQRPNPWAEAQQAAIDTMHAVRKRIKNGEIPKDEADDYLAQAQNVIDKSMEFARADARKTNIVSPQEVIEYLSTAEGTAFCFWIAFEKSYPGQF